MRTLRVIMNLYAKLSTVNLTGTKATGANSNSLRCTVNYCFYLTDIGLPSSVGLTVRVRNVLTENNAFSTNTALCHDNLPPCNLLHL